MPRILAFRSRSLPSALHRPSPLLEALEPRTLFSGAPIEPDPAPEAPESAHEAPAALPVAETTPQTPAADDVATTAAELVFVSTDVAHPEALIAGIDQSLAHDRSIAFIRIDAGDDAFARMTDILSQRTDLTAIHILSHGVEGGFCLGGEWLTLDNIESHADSLAIWGAALRPGGDLLIYGCDTAASAPGAAFAQALARYTGADIAASDDATGAIDLDGDWTLEQTTGTIEASVLAAPGYRAILAPATWSLTGSDSVDEGEAAVYRLSLDGSIPGGQSASVDLALADLTTDAADHSDFIEAIKAAIKDRSDLAFDGNTLTYTPSDTYTVTHDTRTSGFEDISRSDDRSRIHLDDDDSYGIGIGFDFTFYGKTYSKVHVGSNGFLTFDQGSADYTNEDFSAGNTLDDLPAIAVLWDDWDPDDSDSDAIYYETVGSAGSRQLIVQWHKIVRYRGSNPGTFQLVLSEADGSIEFRYKDLTVGSGANSGESATIGLSDGGTRYTQFSYNEDSVRKNERLIFRPDAASMTPLEITLATTDDRTSESGETFRIELGKTTNSALSRETAVETVIVDNDASPPTAGHDTLSVLEDGSTSIRVLANDSAPDGARLRITHVDGQAITDGGDAVSVATGSVRLVGDELLYTPTADYHGAASFTYTVSDGIESATAIVSGSVHRQVETITLTDATAVEGGTLRFTATLDRAVAGGFTVDVSSLSGTALSGTDFTPLATTLRFAGHAGESLTFTVSLVEDSLIEANEQLTIALGNVSNGRVSITDTAIGTITDNDARLAPTGPGTGITTDIELVANATGGFDLIIEDTGTDATDGFASDATDSDSVDNLQIYRLGADYVIRDLDGHWLGSPIVGATRVGTSEIRVPAALVTGSIIIRTGIEDDTVTIGDLGASLAGGLIVNTEDPAGATNDFDTITYSAQLSLGAGFGATFAADTITARADARLAATGGGTITWTAGRNILMSGRSSLSTQSGDITLRANLDDSADGNFAGIWLSGATLASTSGDLALTGRGGDTGHYNDGIRIGTDKASGATASLTTGGAIDLVGTGGTAGSQGAGIYLLATALSTTGTDAGSGISLHGTGGTIGGYAHGVRLLGGTIQTVAGGIDLDGQAGGSGTTSSNQGVTLSGGARIQAGGSGNLTVSGTGGGSLGGLNAGVVLIDAHLTVADGDLALDGSGGSGAAAKNSQNRGIATERASLRSTGSGDIRLVGTGDGGGTKSAGITLVATSVAASGTGDIALSGTGARNGQTLNHGITLATATLQTASGDLQLSGQGGGILRKNNGIDISAKSQLTAGGSGSLQLDGTAGRGDSDNLGVFVATSQLTTAHGDLVLTGTGSGSLDRNRGVALAKSTLRVTGSGDLAVTGTGSTSAAGKNNEGVTIATSTLRTLGTGSLTIQGYGGTGRGFNHGVSILSSALTASDGPLAITGRAAATATGVYNTGLSVQQKSTLSAGGLLSLTGTGGGGSGYNHGLLINNRVTAPGALTTGTAGSGATSLDTAGDYFARR
ncbi:MAG: DUF4347 domain-containing protein [Verrucomicrobiales bacterium]|nr:DUF4347 domain-containing protein [Verrucomicrobiales bacterium]